MSVRMHGYRIRYAKSVYVTTNGEKKFSHNVDRTFVVEAPDYETAKTMADDGATLPHRTVLSDSSAIEATKEFVDKIEYLGAAGWERTRVYRKPRSKPRPELIRDLYSWERRKKDDSKAEASSSS